MAILKQSFPPVQEPAIASFNFDDIASGLGYQDFLLAVSIVGGTSAFELLTTALHSGAQDHQMIAEINFDTSTFNLPRTIKGTAYVSGTIQKESGQDANLTFRILKVENDGSTEVELASAVTLNRTAADATPQPFLVKLSLTETLIIKGELLRLEVIPSNANSLVYVGTSPLDLDGTALSPSSSAATTITKVSIPFRIDV